MTGFGRKRRRALLNLEAWRYFSSYYRDRFRLLFFCGTVAAAQSLLVLPVLLLVRYAFDVAIPGKSVTQLIMVGAGIFLIRTLNSGVALWLRARYIKIVKSAISRMREDLTNKLYSLSRRYYTQLDQNTTHARIVQDTDRLDNASNYLISSFLPALLTSIALVILLIFLNWFLLLVMLTMTPLLFFTLRLTNRHVRDRVYVFQRAFEAYSKGVLFVLHHMDLTCVQSCEKEESQHRAAQVRHLRYTGERMAFIYALHGHLQRTVTGLAGIVILVVGGSAVASGSMTLGEMLSFWVAAGQLDGFARTIIDAVPQIITGNESVITLKRLMDEGETRPYQGGRQMRFSGQVELKDVVFAYEDHTVLNGLNLEITPGANLAIVGPNGVGKSTVAWLILGFYRPSQGRILADGVPYDEIDIADLRRSIGAVTQHPDFFPGSVRENICYGTDRDDLGEIEEAAKIALVDRFIESLPEGFDTQVGEGGVLLSGGEAQRLAIARAVLRRPRLLILDEPTNHLERPSIDRLMENIQSLETRPAILTISHDKQVVDFADEIFALKEGRAVLQSGIPLAAETR